MRIRIARLRRSGFTLVELLTVMVIIGLLASIIMPRVARARFMAELGACQQNLHNIGQAVAMYANDNAQALPSNLNSLTVGTGGQNGYLGAVPSCPSNGQTYAYSSDAASAQYTVTCQGIHYKILSQVSAGFPQYQTTGGLGVVTL